MKNGDWLPLLLSLAIIGTAVIMATLFPETLHLRDIPEPLAEEERDPIELQPSPKSIGHGFQAQLVQLRDAVSFVRRDYTLALVVFTFLANQLGRNSLNLLIRYASQRYGWSIRQVRFLIVNWIL